VGGDQLESRVLSVLEPCRVEVENIEVLAKVILVTIGATLGGHGRVITRLTLDPRSYRLVTFEAPGVRGATPTQFMALRTVAQPAQLLVDRRKLARRDDLRVSGAHRDRQETKRRG